MSCTGAVKRLWKHITPLTIMFKNHLQLISLFWHYLMMHWNRPNYSMLMFHTVNHSPHFASTSPQPCSIHFWLQTRDQFQQMPSPFSPDPPWSSHALHTPLFSQSLPSPRSFPFFHPLITYPSLLQIPYSLLRPSLSLVLNFKLHLLLSDSTICILLFSSLNTSNLDHHLQPSIASSNQPLVT